MRTFVVMVVLIAILSGDASTTVIRVSSSRLELRRTTAVAARLGRGGQLCGNRGVNPYEGNPINDPLPGPGSIQVRRPYPTFGDITYNGQDSSTLWRPISEFYSTEAKARSAEAERHARRFQEMQPKRPPRP